VAPSTYYAAKKRAPSARAVRDTVMLPILVALWTANYSVYGAHKLWKAARRAGHDIGRDQVARLMHQAEIRGMKRGAGSSPPGATTRLPVPRTWSSATSTTITPSNNTDPYSRIPLLSRSGVSSGKVLLDLIFGTFGLMTSGINSAMMVEGGV
jgi:putative transposase